MLEDVRREIVEMHRFFVDWFNDPGMPDPAFERRFAARLAPDFGMIVPSGEWLTRETVTDWIRDAKGERPGHRIEIRNVALLPPSGARLVLARYEEWQAAPDSRSALIATVALEPEGPGRLDTGERATPGGYLWRHVHETTLPESRIAADPFDFRTNGPADGN